MRIFNFRLNFIGIDASNMLQTQLCSIFCLSDDNKFMKFARHDASGHSTNRTLYNITTTYILRSSMNYCEMPNICVLTAQKLLENSVLNFPFIHQRPIP